MQAISWKLGLFYLMTIGLAIGLFYRVTEYGEANLKPQAKITGQYRLKAAEMPDCMQGSVLELQQSGRFLNAVILAEPDLKAPNGGAIRLRQQAMLNGTWENRIELAGTDRQVGNCFVTQVTIYADPKPGGTIAGQLQLNQEDRSIAPPARVINHPTYNNGNPQTLWFQAQKRK
jgi:hypothetical protein